MQRAVLTLFILALSAVIPCDAASVKNSHATKALTCIHGRVLVYNYKNHYYQPGSTTFETAAAGFAKGSTLSGKFECVLPALLMGGQGAPLSN